MKVTFSYLAFLIIIFLAIPFLLYSCTKMDDGDKDINEISLYNHKTKELTRIRLEEYIIGVVSAEMPSSFSENALMAQAVAARTYTAKRLGENYPEHNGGDICSDFAHCQAYNTKADMKKSWGSDYSKNYNKIKNAVIKTRGQVLKYNDVFATTVFHSCSNGITEKASDVWGGDVPYLTNVKSEGDTLKKDYLSSYSVHKSDFIAKLSELCREEINTENKAIGSISYTSGQNVDTIELYGKSFKAGDIRKIFSLKSTAFTLELKDDIFTFLCEGNGHGVGMSQYGAEKMGRDGKSFKEILMHFYPGTKLSNIE